MTGRFLLVCGTLLVLVEVSRSEGIYQLTRDSKTLIWNNYPKPGDVATWWGGRDREGYGRGFGRLTWYTQEPGSTGTQVYARYWGRLVHGKFEGPVNVHSRKKTNYAIFVDGRRVTTWATGTAPTRATALWRVTAAQRHLSFEPESPAAGPPAISEKLRREGSDRTGFPSPTSDESIEDLMSERWPKIDIDDSLRLLVFPPSSLRFPRFATPLPK